MLHWLSIESYRSYLLRPVIVLDLQNTYCINLQVLGTYSGLDSCLSTQVLLTELWFSLR